MREKTTLNLKEEMIGKEVFISGSPQKLGEVRDAIVHPTKGRLLGLLIQTRTGEERILAAHKLLIGHDGVLASDDGRRFGHGSEAFERGGAFAIHEIVGASVVTDAGQLVGCVSAVHVPLHGGVVEYEVAPTGVQRLWRRGLRLSAAAPYSFSRTGSRLIVHTEMLERDAPPYLDDGGGWLELRSQRLMQSARLMLYRYSIPLWFVVSMGIISMMVWL